MSRIPAYGLDFLYDPPRTKGPLGINDAADPNKDVCIAGDTPGPLGTGSDFASDAASKPPRETKCLVFDLPRITERFDEAGKAIARQSLIRIEWKEYKAPALMSLIYTLAGESPGNVVVIEGQSIEVNKKADAEVSRMLSAFLKKCSEGPTAAVKYLEDVDRIHKNAVTAVRDVFEDAYNINQGIIGELKSKIRFSATVKTGSDLIITALSLHPAAGLASAGVSIAYSLAKDWTEAKSADAVIVDTGLPALRDAAIQQADKMLIPKELKNVGKWDLEAKIIQHEEMISKYQEAAIGKKAGKTAKLQTRISQHQVAKARAEKAASTKRRAASKSLKGLSILFAVKDAVKSIKELKEVWEKTE